MHRIVIHFKQNVSDHIRLTFIKVYFRKEVRQIFGVSGIKLSQNALRTLRLFTS